MTYGQLRPLADSDPRQLGGFKVLGLLGEGGMGRVFFGRSPGGWAVAIKVIHVVHTDPSLDDVPHPVREIVARCLAKDPRYRPAPGEVIAALAAIPAAGPGAGEGWLPQPVERLIGQRRAQEAGASADRARSSRAVRTPWVNTSRSGQWSRSADPVRLSCPA